VAKNPMYATTVGLVLAGFRALDDRHDRYLQSQTQVKSHKNDKPSGGTDFFRKIIERTKGLLIDDLDNKNNY
jgi:cell division protein FtsA